MHYNEYLKEKRFTYRRKENKKIQKVTCSSCLSVGFGGGCGVVQGWGFLCDSIFRIWSQEHLSKAAHGDV